MALPKSESFTDANSTTLETHDAGWVNHTTGGQQLDIQSNALHRVTNSIDTFYYWNTDTPTADQYAQAKATVVTTTDGYQGVGVRVQTGTKQHGYWIELANTDRGLYVDGASLIFSDSGALANNDVHYLEVIGSTLKVKINGSTINGSGTTDSTYATAGKLGVYMFGNSLANALRLDDWLGDSLGGGGGGPTVKPLAALGVG